MEFRGQLFLKYVLAALLLITVPFVVLFMRQPLLFNLIYTMITIGSVVTLFSFKD